MKVNILEQRVNVEAEFMENMAMQYLVQEQGHKGDPRPHIEEDSKNSSHEDPMGIEPTTTIGQTV